MCCKVIIQDENEKIIQTIPCDQKSTAQLVQRQLQAKPVHTNHTITIEESNNEAGVR